ncbi:MAG: hypothetical protein JNK35_02290 [Phycisphaerae bacterium]|nr:hypothetical protein [Phycisphaerae bacterium]
MHSISTGIRHQVRALRFGVSTVALVSAGFVTEPARGHHEGDIGLGLSGGRIVTGVFSQAGFVPGRRVFGAEFGALVPNFTDDPGFDSLSGTFPAGSSIGFSIRAGLRAWDGQAFAGPIPESRISVDFSGLGPVLSPLDDAPVPGFALPVSSSGQWHRHLQFTLAAPAADGVYLLELTLEGSAPEVGASRPFWLVFNQNRPEEEHDAAIDWVLDNLASDPSPCAADYNADGTLDPDDLADFIACYFGQTSGAGACPRADFNQDGAADPDDLSDFVAAYFAGC